MAKPAWLFAAWLVAVPQAVWSQSGDQPQERNDEKYSALAHDEGHIVDDDEGSTSIQLPKLNFRGFLDVGFNVSSGDD